MTRRIIVVSVIVVMAISALLAISTLTHHTSTHHTSTHHAMHTSTHGTIVQIPDVCQYDTMQVNCKEVKPMPYAQIFIVHMACDDTMKYCASTVTPITSWNPSFCIKNNKALLDQCTIDLYGNIIVYLPSSLNKYLGILSYSDVVTTIQVCYFHTECYTDITSDHLLIHPSN